MDNSRLRRYLWQANCCLDNATVEKKPAVTVATATASTDDSFATSGLLLSLGAYRERSLLLLATSGFWTSALVSKLPPPRLSLTTDKRKYGVQQSMDKKKAALRSVCVLARMCTYENETQTKRVQSKQLRPHNAYFATVSHTVHSLNIPF